MNRLSCRKCSTHGGEMNSVEYFNHSHRNELIQRTRFLSVSQNYFYVKRFPKNQMKSLKRRSGCSLFEMFLRQLLIVVVPQHFVESPNLLGYYQKLIGTLPQLIKELPSLIKEIPQLIGNMSISSNNPLLFFPVTVT